MQRDQIDIAVAVEVQRQQLARRPPLPRQQRFGFLSQPPPAAVEVVGQELIGTIRVGQPPVQVAVMVGVQGGNIGTPAGIVDSGISGLDPGLAIALQHAIDTFPAQVDCQLITDIGHAPGGCDHIFDAAQRMICGRQERSFVLSPDMAWLAGPGGEEQVELAITVDVGHAQTRRR